MGKVFSAAEIANNQIPQPGAHEAAGRYILNEFFEGADRFSTQRSTFQIDEHVVSAMVYGSTALGTAGLRSDVDVLVRYNTGTSIESLEFIGEVFSKATAEHKVPVEANVRPGMFGSFGPETIDPLFAQHLAMIQDQDEPRWSYNWPASSLESGLWGVLPPERVNEIASNYTAVKMRHFANAITQYRGQANLQVMQRALELPNAIGRKALVVTPWADGETATMSGTVALQMRLNQYFKNTHLSWFDHESSPLDLTELREIDAEYDELLLSTIATETTLEEYQGWVEGNYQTACRLGFSVSRMWQTIISNHSYLRTQEGTFLEDGQGQLAFDIEVQSAWDDDIY